MQLKKISLVLLIIIIFTIGCSSNEVIQEGIVSYSSSTSLGSVDSEGNITRFKYSLNITNESINSYFITSIEPVLSDDMVTKLINDEVVQKVNEELNPKETIKVIGEIIIDTQGMTKEEIIDFTDSISNYKTNVEMILEINNDH